jgi:acetolactate synthase-1/2/3 large subunit
MMGSLVQRAVRVSSPDEAAVAVHEAFAEWRSARPRPAYIEVPIDVLEEPWSGTIPAPGASSLPPEPDIRSIEQAAEILARAQRPAAIIGGGARGASRAVEAIVELISAPTVSSVNGKGILPETHELSLGASLRLRSAQRLLEEADALLLVGTELGDSDLWGHTLALSGAVIRVDIDDHQLDKNAPAKVGIRGDAEVVLDLLLRRLRTANLVWRDRKSEIAIARSAIAKEAELSDGVWKAVQDAIRPAVTGDVVVAGDSAQVSYYGTVHHWPMGPADRFLYPTGYATLGYGLPAAIGAKVAAPEKETIVLVGDGGFMFSCQELITAVELGMNLPVVVMNNGGFREIRDQMIERGIEPLGVDLASPNFAALGTALGGCGLQLDNLGQLGDAVRNAFGVSVPTVIELRV